MNKLIIELNRKIDKASNEVNKLEKEYNNYKENEIFQKNIQKTAIMYATLYLQKLENKLVQEVIHGGINE